MISAFLPPSSHTTFFMCRWPGWTMAATRLISRPTALEPVKAMTATSGWATSRAPTSSPSPGRSWKTPVGAPAARSASARRHATPGVCSAGFRITGLPAASAATVIPHGMASGKFHGAMTTVTPLPW